MTSIKISSVWEEAGSVSSQEEGRTWARPAAWINDESVAFYVARLSQSSAPKWAFFFFHSLGQQRLNFLNDFVANIADPSFAPLIDVFRLKLCWVLGSFWQWQSKWFITTHSTDTASLCFGFFPSLLIVELRKKKRKSPHGPPRNFKMVPNLQRSPSSVRKRVNQCSFLHSWH